MPAAPLHYQRRFALAGALTTLVEATLVGAPLYMFFQLDERQRWLMHRAGPVVLGGVWLIWLAAVHAWRKPIDLAVRLRRTTGNLDAASLQAAIEATVSLPRRAAWLRIGLGVAAAIGLGVALADRSAGLPSTTVSLRSLPTIVVVAAFHGAAVQTLRVIAWSAILGRVRTSLQPDGDPLRLFHRLYQSQLLRAAVATGGLGVAGTAAFTLLFLPINLEHYVDLETWMPLTLVPLSLVWFVVLRRLCRPIERYLVAAGATNPAEQPSRDDPLGRDTYRTAQALPYQLLVAKLVLSVAGEALLAMQAWLLFAVDVEAATLFFGAALVVTVGASLYEVLWYRATIRPFLAYLATRHRPRPDAVRTPFSLRTKMLAAFGGLTFFACGLSLFLSFVQYKTLATNYIQRLTELRRDRLIADLRAAASRSDRAPLPEEIQHALADEARDETVIYYLPPTADAQPVAMGGGKQGPPPLRATNRALMVRREAGQMDIPEQHLTGAYARLFIDKRDLGSIAVLYPGYRGRGNSIERSVQELVFFFFLIVIASMGIVVLVATDLTGPIRLLERRAAAMAQGDLIRPVIHVAGEFDEVGRLTYAFEEMRRALNEKLRSSTEINLSLEQEVTRRTAELERRNRELGEALEALRRTQDELIRSEKMASMGRLVAGIAHEINNPVNAVVNTVAPLEHTLDDLLGAAPAEPGVRAPLSAAGELAADVREMLRVIKNGARRTKEIVQALHNYSRGDEDRLIEVDLHRGIDESLDLLRHHLKHGIHVVRRYGEVGRVLGYPGQLQQVLMNLLTNAAQALDGRSGGGTITITTERRDGKVVIKVGDDGPGIAEEFLPRIFDPFFTTKEVGQGSGLGLSIVHGIVERHGGNIAVESHVGKGTVFTVTLPAPAVPQASGQGSSTATN